MCIAYALRLNALTNDIRYKYHYLQCQSDSPCILEVISQILDAFDLSTNNVNMIRQEPKDSLPKKQNYDLELIRSSFHKFHKLL